MPASAVDQDSCSHAICGDEHLLVSPLPGHWAGFGSMCKKMRKRILCVDGSRQKPQTYL